MVLIIPVGSHIEEFQVAEIARYLLLPEVDGLLVLAHGALALECRPTDVANYIFDVRVRHFEVTVEIIPPRERHGALQAPIYSLFRRRRRRCIRGRITAHSLVPESLLERVEVLSAVRTYR